MYLIKDNLPIEVLVETQSLQKRGSGEASRVFEPQTDPIQQLPWHKDAVQAFEACAHEVLHPSTQAKKDEPFLWMGKYLKPGKLSQRRSTYFKPKGASSIIFIARVNANLVDVSGPLKEKHNVSLSEKDTEVVEALSREATALQSHLLWLTDLLVAFTQRLDQSNASTTIQPIMAKVLEHQKWATLATNLILVNRELGTSPSELWVVRFQKMY